MSQARTAPAISAAHSSRISLRSQSAEFRDHERWSLLEDRYERVRNATEHLCEPLSNEDYVIQSMPDVSPTKWHLAHSTWFFEAFVLNEASASYQPFHPEYNYLFNSYYNTVGEPFCRPRRGEISRPTVAEVFDYRRAIDDRMRALLREPDRLASLGLADVVELGLNHEQQHQELILTDIKHVLSINPLQPAYAAESSVRSNSEGVANVEPVAWHRRPAGLYTIGYDGNHFAYDNEGPSHQVYLEEFEINTRLVTNSEYLQFIDDGGYTRPNLWLSDGWNLLQQQQWTSPLYWQQENDGSWSVFTLHGRAPINPDEPVTHVSFYEADAFARWSGFRLPREQEWEIVARDQQVHGNLAEMRWFHPLPCAGSAATASQHNPVTPMQMYGDVWEWTESPYSPYPRFRAAPGALGEYNGKFMCNQMVLRGGSCATPQSHIRSTYRNFFPPHARWQFAGIRLARYC